MGRGKVFGRPSAICLRALLGLYRGRPRLSARVLGDVLDIGSGRNCFCAPRRTGGLVRSLSTGVRNVKMDVDSVRKDLVMDRMFRNAPTRGTNVGTKSVVVSTGNRTLSNVSLSITADCVGNGDNAAIGVRMGHRKVILDFSVIHTPVGAPSIRCRVLRRKVKCVGVAAFSGKITGRFDATLGALTGSGTGGVVVSIHGGNNNCLSRTITVTSYFLPGNGLVASRGHGGSRGSGDFCTDKAGPKCGTIILVGRCSTDTSRILATTLIRGKITVTVNRGSCNGNAIRSLVNLPKNTVLGCAATCCGAPGNGVVSNVKVVPRVRRRGACIPLSVARFASLGCGGACAIKVDSPRVGGTGRVLDYVKLCRNRVSRCFSSKVGIALTTVRGTSGYIPRANSLSPLARLRVLGVLYSARILRSGRLGATARCLGGWGSGGRG